MKKIIRIAIVPVLFFLFLFQNIKLSENHHRQTGLSGVLYSDAYGYYEYLPAKFIRDDLKLLKSGLRVSDSTGVNKYTCGVALLQAPFFLVNYSIQKMKGFSGTGFENSYGYTVLISTSVYVFLGLWMLFSFLKKRFSLLASILAIPIVLYATNMFHYVFAEAGMSHAYSFFCISGILFFTDRFYKTYETNGKILGINLFAVAIFTSLAVLIRPTSIVTVLIFFLYNCYSLTDLKNRIIFFFKNYWILLFFLLIALLVFSPQIYYWHLTTGKLFLFTYGLNNETFSNWHHPRVMLSLFGHMGGWFPYSPIMFISVMTMFIMLYKQKHQALLIFIVMVLITYICSSWWAYNFMCAFGYRSFIEFYPLFILPLIYLIHSIMERKSKALKITSLILIAGFIYVGFRMNIDFHCYPWCIDYEWSWRSYFKLYEHYF